MLTRGNAHIPVCTLRKRMLVVVIGGGGMLKSNAPSEEAKYKVQNRVKIA